jgi:hypothetical protein
MNHRMDERQFYEEKEETKPVKVVCPGCKKESDIPVRWKVRTKKAALPRGASDEDRAKFAKARSYMVRVDDLVACRKCRKRIEITGQSVVLVDSAAPKPGEEFDPENFGNR